MSAEFGILSILYPFLIYIRKCFHSSNLNDLLQAVASFEIASNVRKDSCGFIFGVNTFAALFFQTVLTVVVADDIGLALPPRDQVTLTSGNSLQKSSRQVSSKQWCKITPSVTIIVFSYICTYIVNNVP